MEIVQLEWMPMCGLWFFAGIASIGQNRRQAQSTEVVIVTRFCDGAISTALAA
jgi:hypothetical protein